MPNISGFDAGNLAIRPTEIGVDATAATARRIGMFSNQLGSAEEMLARSTEHLGQETRQVGGDVQRLGGEQQRLGSEQQRLGSEFEQQGDYVGNLERDTGRRVASTVTDVGNVATAQIEHQEINRGAAAWAQLVERKTAELNDTTARADPNDTQVATRFMAGMEDELQQFRNGFLTENGQKWAEGHIDALRLHLAEKAHADMATMAGIAAEKNVRQTVNSLSNTVHGDPSSLSFALAGLNSSIEGSIATSANLRGPEGAKLRDRLQQSGAEAIVKSAAVGYIEKTGQVPPWATDPQFSKYINGAELTMLARAAQVQQRADRLAQNQIDLYNRQQADQAVHAGASKILTDNVSIDPQSGRPVIAPGYFQSALDLAKKNPDAPSAAATARTLLDWGEHQQNLKDQPTRSDPGIKADLMTRMFDPDKPTSKVEILRAQIDGKLSNADVQPMLHLQSTLEEAPLKGPIYQSTMTAVKGILGDSEKGHENYAKFIQTFIPEYLRQKAAGTLPPDALDLKNENSLISKSLNPWKLSPQEKMMGHIFKNLGVGVDPNTIVNSPLGGQITGVQTVNAPPLPPPAQREVGKTYELPKGKFKWNGSGWEKP